jgi:hypothetical protein
MLRLVLTILALGLALLLVYAGSRPDTFRIQRSVRIQAPSERIFPLLDDFRRWAAWSPWDKKDPAMRRTLGGAESGVGATYAWEGNSDVGKGRMAITASVPRSRVEVQLDIEQPMQARNDVVFLLEPDGDGTRVTWSMSGGQTFLGKLVGVFLDMDQMVGRDFEAGLATLKALAEQPLLDSPPPPAE